MINYPLAPTIGDIHTYLGNSWEFTGVGWKKYLLPAEATGWTILPSQLGIEISLIITAVPSYFSAISAPLGAGIEVSLTSLPLALPQPFMLDYI